MRREGRGEERRAREGEQRRDDESNLSINFFFKRIKASSLLAGSPPSPDHPSISRKLTPQNLFGRDDVDEMTGTQKVVRDKSRAKHN